MGWRILEINKNSHIKLFLNNLIVTGETNISISVHDIDVILFTNPRTNISVNLLNELVEQNICVFFCDSKYMPCSMVFPIIGNLLTLKVFNEQIQWSQTFKAKAWKKIVELKCSNQISYLKFLDILSDREYLILLNYLNGIEENDSTNREGHIAKIYWNKLFNTNFSRENDFLTINKILNYGYTIINGMVARSIIKKGLDSRIGIFHKSVYNHFALSSDLIEPFRNVIDILVIELIKNNIITIEETNDLTIELKEICLDFIANFKLMINGFYQQLNNAIDEFVDSLVNKTIFDVSIEYSYEVEINDNLELEEDDKDVNL